MDSEAAILAAIDLVADNVKSIREGLDAELRAREAQTQLIREELLSHRQEFDHKLELLTSHVARSDEVQDVKAAVSQLTARLGVMPTKADCDRCHENFVDKRTFIGGVGGLGLLGTIALAYDKIKSLF